MTDILDAKFQESINKYSLETQKEVIEYLNTLDEQNKKGYEIAFDHLGTSFNITRCNGFKKWKSKMAK